MILFDSLSTYLLHFPRQYSDLCLLTGASELEPIQRLVTQLTLQRVIGEVELAEQSPLVQFFQLYREKCVVASRREESVNKTFYQKAVKLLASSHSSSAMDELLEEWYMALWNGVRREIELNVSASTLLLFSKEKLILEKFLQYFLNLLSIGALAGSDRKEVSLAVHCFMAAEP